MYVKYAVMFTKDGFLYPLLEETNFPDELIMNYDTERFLSYLNIPAGN